MDQMDYKIMDLKQRVVDMKQRLDNKSDNAKPDPLLAPSKTLPIRDLFQSVVQAATSDDQYANVLHNRERQLRERIEKARSKLPLKK